jgi:hypothetical protein
MNEEECKNEWAKYCAISALEVGLNKLGNEMKRELVLDLHNNNTYESAQNNDKQKCIYNKTKLKKEFVVEHLKELVCEWNVVDDHQDVEF